MQIRFVLRFPQKGSPTPPRRCRQLHSVVSHYRGQEQESRQPCRQPLPGHVVVAATRARMLTGTSCADRVLRHWRGREHGRSSAAVAPAASSVPAGARLRRRSESADAPRQPRRPQLTAVIIVAPRRAPVAGGPVGAPGRCRRCRRLRCARRACLRLYLYLAISRVAFSCK